MKSQAERPPKQGNKARPARSNVANRSKRYTRQTARGIDTKRDGKPLIFGWGKNLSHSEKLKLQHRAVWGFTSLVVLIIVAVIVGSWINTNIIIPGLPLTSVNGHLIPQSQLKKMAAFQTLVEDNKIYGRNGLTAQSAALQKQDAAQLTIINNTTKTINTLNSQIAKLPKGPSSTRTSLESQLKTQQAILKAAQDKHTNLTSQITTLTQGSTLGTIPFEQQNFADSPIASDSATWLQEDELIREWLATQSSSLQNQINPTSSAVAKAVSSLAANVPTNTTYSSLLSQMGVSDSDMQAMMTISMRRDNMQTYLASTIKSPAYQVLARSITVATQAAAQKILNQLKADHASDFGTVARKQSQDTTTAPNGGDLGWLIRGEYAQSEGTGTIDNWLFDPARYAFELSPVLVENGTYRVLQIESISPSRAIDATTLKSAQSNALANWLLEVKAEPSTIITTPDSNMLTDSNNLPPASILPIAAPSGSSTSPTGLSGSDTAGLI